MRPIQTARLRAVLAGLPLLAMVTSCVAPAAQRYRISQDVPEPDARGLLRRLALDVPKGTPLAPGLSPDAGGASPLTAAPPFMGPQAPDDAARAQDCLTAAIYYEARSQSDDGERAVAQVVLNRVRDRAFPKSVCGVVYQGAGRRTGCQFSFACDGSTNARRDERGWLRASGFAERALAGEVYGAVGSATHYHADYVTPWWSSSLARVTKVGAHIFYRWKEAIENALAFRQQYAGNEPEAGVPRGDVAAASGVTVHYGSDAPVDMVGAVTIHRGAEAPRAVRASFVSGVRIHGGIAPGAHEGGEAAEVSDEI